MSFVATAAAADVHLRTAERTHAEYTTAAVTPWPSADDLADLWHEGWKEKNRMHITEMQNRKSHGRKYPRRAANAAEAPSVASGVEQQPPPVGVEEKPPLPVEEDASVTTVICWIPSRRSRKEWPSADPRAAAGGK